MKEVITSLISISVGTALLTVTLVSDKYKGNIRALSSLIIAAFLLSQFAAVDFNGFELPSSTVTDEQDVFLSALTSAENIVNDTVKDRISEKYNVSCIEVESQCEFTENSYEITKIIIKINTDIPISEIMNFTEDEFGMYGKISVVKISDEVDDCYEIE